MYLKILNILFILLIPTANCYSKDISHQKTSSLAQEISYLLKNTNWVYDDEKVVYFDIDKDGKDEVITFAYRYDKDITYINTLILKRKNNNQLSIYMENPMIQRPMSADPYQYAEDEIFVKDDMLEIYSTRGTALRTSVISVFRVTNGKFMLIKQEVNTYRNTDGELLSRKYDFLTGNYTEVAENILDQECRPNLTEKGVFGSICKNDKEYTEKKEIKSQKPMKYISFDDLCSHFYDHVNFSFSCSENKYRIKDKTYLYKVPNLETNAYLVKNDLINIIDKRIDDNQQRWFFINYKGKKEINMWVKAETVDINEKE
ncbi:MAG TPA: hypothetical protein DD638_08950 [Pasteurellaceae bacterium]|nr:hypothetical protein [Pasteurellaceae bacterium]